MTDKKLAVDTYLELINSNQIRKSRRDKLYGSFTYFLAYRENDFWSKFRLELSKRKLAINTETTANEAAIDLQEAAVKQSRERYSQVSSRNNADVKRSFYDDDTVAEVIDHDVEELAETEITNEVSTGATPFSEVTSSISSMAPALSSSSKRRKADKPITKKNRRSLEGHYQALRGKWILASGTIVEDVLYTAGSDEACASLSFMLDLDDAKTKALFSEEDWNEIISDLPPYENYGEEAGEYLDKCMEVASIEDMRKILEKRQHDPESQLGEAWWKDNAWGVCRRLTTGIKGSFIIMGEKAGHDSSDRRNQDITTVDRKKIGVKADFLWRTISSPDIDWSAGESATVWDSAAMKYRNEGVFKLPRQLHDILVARTCETGGVDSLRQEYVCGLLTGGPVIQRVQICWGTKGENITRFFRSPERRLFPTVQELGISLMAVHDLLVLRATTLRLCNKYEESRREFAKASIKMRRQELLIPSVSPKEKKRKFSLLSSSL
ncbi:hypothetical protein BGX21_004131 [Mortierella sp. AD011]|nr:hypothetical protein BGX21_004131 [Mortierella sp. AD011]